MRLPPCAELQLCVCVCVSLPLLVAFQCLSSSVLGSNSLELHVCSLKPRTEFQVNRWAVHDLPVEKQQPLIFGCKSLPTAGSFPWAIHSGNTKQNFSSHLYC